MLFLHLLTKLFLQISSKSSCGYQMLLVSSGLLISTRVMRALAIGSIHSTSSGSLQKAVSHTTRNLLASVGIHLYTGLACYGALEIHHGTAKLVPHGRLALLHSSGSSSGAGCAMAGRVSCTRSSCSAGASCCASMMAGVVSGTNFLFGRRCRVTASDRVA